MPDFSPDGGRGIEVRLRIDLARQLLELIDPNGVVVRSYVVSTAARGAGEDHGSYRTPRGRHVVRAKIGGGLPVNAVLVSRRPTGEIYRPELAGQEPERDWILSRILWLSGSERGRNRLGAVDTMRRYIYIHGAPDEAPMGEPHSHGCIRMRNADVIDLFERVAVGTPVDIEEEES